jgi:transcriptional regulator with XRE-family HTH domain
METEPTSIHEVLRNARRALGMTQSELALAVDCQQSAISMFEAGRPDVLASETVEKMAQKLGVDLRPIAGCAKGESAKGPKGVSRRVMKYCPVDECPSNIPFVVRGRLLVKPRMVHADADEKTRCALCGEILEQGCPNPACRASVRDGAFCTRCGTPYVTSTDRDDTALARWADRRRRRIRELMAMAQGESDEALWESE